MKLHCQSLTFVVILSGLLAGCSRHSPAGIPEPKPAATNAPANAAPAAPVSLKLKWQVGRRYLLRMETVQNWQGEAQNNQPPPEQTISLAHDYGVTVRRALPDGGRELEVEFVAQKLHYFANGITWVNFDSAQKPEADQDNPVAPLLRKLTGARVTCQLDAAGKVTGVQGFKELNDRMAGGMAEIRQMIAGFLNEENLRQLFDVAEALPPDGAVKPGDTWQRKLALPDPTGIMNLDMQCTFAAWDSKDGHPCARIAITGPVTSQPKAAAGSRNMTQIDTGTLDTKAWLDPELGMLINTATEMHLQLTTTTAGKAVHSRANFTINTRLVSVSAN